MPLITIEENPFNAETELADLAQTVTPTERFFVRSHFPVPKLDATGFRLRLDGAVQDPLEVDLKRIQALRARHVMLTLECAGNGRTVLEPPVPGVRWGFGAVGTAQFTGTPVRHLLDLSRVRESAKEVLFIGADRGEVEPGRTVAFERSLPLEVAMENDTLLAWEMNGEPLTADHGAPLRLVVPRWYAVASVKWLTGIRLLTETFAGHYQGEKYVYEKEAGTRERTPVQAMRVRAIMAHPVEDENLAAGAVEIRGMAWGEAAIRKVDVSTDGGASWDEAALGTAPSPHAWTPWSLRWVPPRPGEHILMARARDAEGRTQPLESSWNTQGYGNNVVQRVRVIAGAG